MDKNLDCFSFDCRVQDLMDERIELRTDLPLQNHAAECESCRSLLSSFESLESALGAAFPFNAVEDESKELDSFASPRISDHQKTVASWGIAGAVLAMAAMLLLMLQPVSESFRTDDLAELSLPPATAPSAEPGATEPNLLADDSSEFEPSDINSAVYHSIPTSLRNAYQYAVELPGIRPIECSINVTLDVLQKSLGPFPTPKPGDLEPDLGKSHQLAQDTLA